MMTSPTLIRPLSAAGWPGNSFLIRTMLEPRGSSGMFSSRLKLKPSPDVFFTRHTSNTFSVGSEPDALCLLLHAKCFHLYSQTYFTKLQLSYSEKGQMLRRMNCQLALYKDGQHKKHLDCPPVAGCIIGYNPLPSMLADGIRARLKLKVHLILFFLKMVSVILGTVFSGLYSQIFIPA